MLLLKAWLARALSKRAGKAAGKGLGALLALIGGLTTIEALQPAVERSADYGARAIELFCELPAVDRDRFADEVNERLNGTIAARIDIECP